MSSRLIRRIKTDSGRFRRSTLLMNSIYLMLATIAVAASGFIFWVIITRSYATSTVGLAATLLALSGLLSMLSLAGFDTTFVRFLPGSTRKSDQINSGLIIVALTSALLSTALVLSFPLTSPNLVFVLHNPLYFISFVFFTVATSLNVLTNAIFLSLKRAWDIFIINILFSAFKVALPLLVREGNAMTIFVLVGVSQLAGLLLSLIIIKAELGYVFSPKVHWDILGTVKQYSLWVYVSSILNLLPPTLLPLLVVHRLGPENAAYYYMAFTIAGVLYTISYASMQSAFAEGSHDESSTGLHVAKAAKLIGALLVPAILACLVLSGFILKIFGKQYAANGSTVLRLFAVSALSVAIYSALGTIFKVTKDLRSLVAMNLVYATVILSLSYMFIPRFGLMAVGWAWMFGNVAAVAVGFIFFKYRQGTKILGGM